MGWHGLSPTRLGRALTGREAALFTRCLIACSPEDALGILFPFLESHLRTAFPEAQRLLVGLCKRQADLPAHAQSALLAILRRLTALFLKSFLADPVALSYELRAAQSRRTHVESNIRAWLLDLDHSTVKTGSPHRLVMRKNSATFERLHSRYQAERRLLGVLASCHFGRSQSFSDNR